METKIFSFFGLINDAQQPQLIAMEKFGLGVDPENGEVVGLEIDDFEAIFLKRHPELAEAWAEVKPRRHRKKVREYTESFVLIIFNFLQAFLRDNPQQTGLDVVPAG